MKIVYTDIAKEGIEAIYQFNSLINQQFAIRVYNSILEEIEIIEKYPSIGLLEPLLINNFKQYRSLIISPTISYILQMFGIAVEIPKNLNKV